MKIKRSSSKKQLHKWTKLGVGLAAVTVLGGLVEPGVADFGLTKVYATEQADPALEARKIEIKTMIQSYRDLVGQIKALNPADYTEESWNKNYDGDVRIYLGAQSIATAYNDDLTFSSLSLDGIDSHQTLNELNATYMFGYQFVENSIPILKQAMADLVPVSKSLETPVVSPPAETQVVTAKVTAFKLEELVGANYKYQPMGTFSLEPVVVQLQPGETYTPPSYDGYKLVKFEYRNSVTDITPEEATISYADFTPGQEISLDYYYLNTKQVYDVLNKRYVDRDTNLSPLPPTETPTIDNTTDTPTDPQPTNSQPTVEDRYDVVTLQYRDENGEDLGEDLMMVYPTSSQRITPPTFEGYEFKEASVGENYLMYRKPISLPYEHRFAQVLTEQDLQSHSNFLGGRIKEAQDSLRDGSAYTYILNYRKTSLSQQAPQPAEIPVVTSVDKPVEIPVDSSVPKPAETPSETPAKSPAETPTNQPSADQAGQSTTEPTALSKQDSQAGTASPTSQSAPGKQETKQETKEQAAPASQSKQSTDKPASTSQPQAKTLPATGEASSVLHLTGLGLLGLAGLVVRRRSGKSS